MINRVAHQEEATGGNAASVTYDHVTYDHAAPLHEIEPEAPAKLSNHHAVYTTESTATGAAPAPAPTSYFYDSRIQQQHQQQHHPQQQQQQHHPQHSQQQLQPLTNGFVAEQQPGFESQKLNELRQKYASPPQRPTTAASSTTASSTTATSVNDAENEVAVEAVTTSAPRVTVSVSKSVTTSVRRVTADGVTLITPLGNGNADGGGESGKLKVDMWRIAVLIR